MARAKHGGDVFECVSAFSAVIDGQEVRVRLGDRVRAGHALIAGRESFFRPLEVQYDVEAATAEPGEKRGAK